MILSLPASLVSTVRADDLGRFKLIASAIAGRTLEVAAVKEGEPAWTDGATIFADVDVSRSDQLRCIAVQAALLAAGSLEPDVVRGLERRPALIRRYLAVEGHRALAAQEGLLPTAVRSLIDRAVAARSASPACSLAVAKGRGRLADPPPTFGTIRTRQLRARNAASGEEGATRHGVPRPARHPLDELDDEDDGGRVVPDFASIQIGGGGPLGRLLAKLLGDRRATKDGAPGADAPTRWSGRAARVARTGAATTAAASLAGFVDPASATGTTYPEWDVYRRRYRDGWCTVVEVEPEKKDLAPFAVPEARALRRSLARLGMELERRRRQLQGDDVDLDAAVEAHVASLAGSPPGEAIYIESLRCRRDLAVLLLLDISGSAREPSPTGATVHQHQRAASAALAVALHELGDRVALYGFRSKGRFAVHVVPVKQFRDDLDGRVMARLGGLVPGGFTRLGAAIRHAAFVLERDGGMSRRLLVVLSDGFAYDHGYDGPYGEADARRALGEARRRGTGCLCLSVAASTDAAALRRVFGTAAHATIPRPEQLAAVVGPLFRAALRSAQLQRRASQRRERTHDRLAIERSKA
jgi:hypothetical protein